jgi:hypothetical protein
MKEFIICPKCGSMELADRIEDDGFRTFGHECSRCNYLIMCSNTSIYNAKAISIRQPWAYLIAADRKPIENRSWKTNFRGRVLIHTGAKIVKERLWKHNLLSVDQWYSLIPSDHAKYISNPQKWTTSAIIGSVEIVDCIQNSTSMWANPDCWHWILKDPIMFEKPILNVKGKLSFFIPEIPDHV